MSQAKALLPVPPLALTVGQTYDLAVSTLCDQLEVQNPCMADLYVFAAQVFGVDSSELEHAVKALVRESEAIARHEAGHPVEQYSAVSGQKAALFDIARGRPGYHQNASNSPAYRTAYDAAIAKKN
jgi:hypothetical protein